MDLSDTGSGITFLAAVAMVVGVIGVIVPMVPGLVLCWLAVLAWALFGDHGAGADGAAAADADGGGGWGRWVVLAVATLIGLAGVVAKYAWPGRNLKRSGVPNLTLLAGGALGLVGFFLIPVVGLVVGFVVGVWLAERVRLGDSRLAWPSTKHALMAAGLAMLIELAAALGIAFVWVVGLVAT